MRLTYWQISKVAALTALFGTLAVLAAELATRSGSYPIEGYFVIYLLVGVLSWPVCWFAIALSTLMFSSPALWSPLPASLVGAGVGLLAGAALAFPLGLFWWIGLPYGLLAGFLAGQAYRSKPQ